MLKKNFEEKDIKSALKDYDLDYDMISFLVVSLFILYFRIFTYKILMF